MPAEKLGDEKARANCGKCRHTFFLNAHLVDTSQTSKDDLTTRQAPRSKKPKPASKDNTSNLQIDNQTDNLDLDGLDDFLHPDKNTSNSSDGNEAWLDELINNHDPIKTIPTSRTNDDLSELIGADLETLIPEAPSEKNPDIIRQKISERISHSPSQEQLVTKRSLLGQIMWGIGALSLLGFLAGQYIFFNGDGLAKAGKGSFISNLCKTCLPSADISTLTTNYSLQNGQADFSTDLIGTINNTSATAQLYPNLKISVMGKNGLIGDLALAPKDYLDTPQKLIGASSNGRFMLTLDAPIQEIVSVRIEPFY